LFKKGVRPRGRIKYGGWKKKRRSLKKTLALIKKVSKNPELRSPPQKKEEVKKKEIGKGKGSSRLKPGNWGGS